MTQARKSLGQHFLPQSYCEKMVSRLSLSPDDQVLEIGSGPGALTRALLPRVARLISIELDPRFADVGHELVQQHGHFTFVPGDFLALDLKTLGLDGGPWKVVANIPYYITTPILEKLLGPDRPLFSELDLLVQWEVAERILAEGSRESGSLTLFVAWYAVPHLIMKVPGRIFSPPAKVDSALLQLVLRQAPPVPAAMETVFAVVHAAFAQRRKMLRSSLRVRWSESQLVQAFRDSGVPSDSRPESLTLKDFGRLAEALSQET